MRVRASGEPKPDTAKGVPVHAPIVIPPRTMLRPQGADLPGIRTFTASPIPGAMRFPEVDCQGKVEMSAFGQDKDVRLVDEGVVVNERRQG